MQSRSSDPITAFTNAIEEAGLPAPSVVVGDGQLHRFSTNGKSGDDAGWYVLHMDGVPAGAFGCWRTPVESTWCAKSDSSMTKKEREAHKAQMAEARKKREEDKKRRQQKVAEQAKEVWPQLEPAPADHPYLKAKGVKPHGLRVDEDGLLVVPMYTLDNTLWSYQTIDDKGDKQFPFGGRVTGCCYPIGKIGTTIYVAEGVATGASIYEATGAGVVCAFNCNNLEPVARSIRDKYPDALIVLCADNDSETDGNPGITKAREAAKSVGGLMVSPDIKGDFNDLQAAQGLAEVRKQVNPLPEIAYSKSILDQFEADIARCGVVGEQKTASTVYLAITSRLLDNPVSVAVKGNSSGGKSYTTEKTIDFFPEDAVISMTAMSERALVYSDEDYQHRTLTLLEATALREGSQDDMTSYFVRTLLSEGRIEYKVTVKEDGQYTGKTIRKDGPTNIIITTTKTKVHAENETRLLSLAIDDTREQTARIFTALAAEDAESVDLDQWHRLQSWLQTAEKRVSIPFAQKLAGMVPPVAIRLRRDFGQVLALIRAHAILHQATRERDSKGRIIATIDDYAKVRELVADIVSEGVGATVKQEVRETVDVIDRLVLTDAGGVMAKQIAEAMELDKGTVSRRLRMAADDGYIRNLEDKRGRPGRWTTGDPMPEELDLLPAPHTLESSCNRATAQPCNSETATGPANTGGCTVAREFEGVMNESQTPATSKKELYTPKLPHNRATAPHSPSHDGGHGCKPAVQPSATAVAQMATKIKSEIDADINLDVNELAAWLVSQGDPEYCIPAGVRAWMLKINRDGYPK